MVEPKSSEPGSYSSPYDQPGTVSGRSNAHRADAGSSAASIDKAGVVQRLHFQVAGFQRATKGIAANRQGTLAGIIRQSRLGAVLSSAVI